MFASIFFVVDIYMLQLYNETFATVNKDVIAAIIATNPSEAQEFISTYLTIEKLLIVVASISLLLTLFYYVRRLHFKLNNLSRIILMVMLLISAIITFKRCERIKENNMYYLLYSDCPDLREYRQHPMVVCNTECIDNIVLILGESFCKFNSSLYEYDKETNPFLNNLRNNGNLFVYENVSSACTNTIPAVKSIMMSYIDSMSDSVEWYRCLTIIETMQQASYKACWLSNQSKFGLFDNEVGRFADLCDEQFFVGNKNSGMNRDNKDEELLPAINDILSDSVNPCFTIIQLMGSHSAFKNRYPETFEIFKASDYDTTHPNLSVENKQLLAEYDNSILYNDYVVYEILQRFAEKEAVVFYFSDHGIDVFQSSDNYIGHGKHSNTVSERSAKQIPFMVYTTSLFREKHPEMQLRIENAVNRSYRTDSIMYTIMDVAGVETVNGVSYKHRSLFK